MKVPIRVACRKSRGREAVPKQGEWAPSLPPADAFLARPCGFTGQLERTHKLGFLLPAEKELGWAAKPHTATGGQHAEQEGRPYSAALSWSSGPCSQICGLKEGEGERVIGLFCS